MLLPFHPPPRNIKAEKKRLSCSILKKHERVQAVHGKKPQPQKCRELATTANTTVGTQASAQQQPEKLLRCPSEGEHWPNSFVTHHISTWSLIICLGRKKYIYIWSIKLAFPLNFMDSVVCRLNGSITHASWILRDCWNWKPGES